MMQKQFVTVKALIQQDGNFLFLKDRNGMWELPGGKVQFGESPMETLERELYEELSLRNIVIGKVVDAWSFCLSAHGDDYQFIVLVFRCSIQSATIKLSSEHVEYRWIPPDSIDDFEMREGYRKTVKKVKTHERN